jgi:hypothetical protein
MALLLPAHRPDILMMRDIRDIRKSWSEYLARYAYPDDFGH